MSAFVAPPGPPPPRPTSGTRGWWIAFAVTCIIVIGYSLAVGEYLAGRREPQQLGTSDVGEWADMAEYGFRLRVDEIAVVDSLPARFSDEIVTAPTGMAYFEAKLTVEVLVAPDEDMGCILELYNADGEKLDWEDTSVGIPDVSGCLLFDDGRDALDVGDTFESQFIRVVLPDEPGSFTIHIVPTYTEDTVYWAITG